MAVSRPAARHQQPGARSSQRHSSRMLRASGPSFASTGARRMTGGVSILALVAALFPLVALVAASPASAANVASAAGAPLSCDGSTIYSVQRGTGSSPTANGSLWALQTSTVGSASVTSTLVTTIPDGGFTNGLGITRGGAAAYVVDQSTSAVNAAIIHGYDASTQTWTTYTGGGSLASSSFVAGAVDPTTGFYYYVSYAAGSGGNPATGTVFGFNTATNTPVSGIIATFSLPTGLSTAGQNGDIAFDSAGNMYVLASDGTNVAIGVVRGPIPTTGSVTGVPLTDTVLSTFTSSSIYNGIAFDNAGHLYTNSTSGSTSMITKLDPVTGAVISGPTPLSSNAQTLPHVDLGACSVNPGLSLQKNIVHRYAPGDQFGLNITGAGGSNSATTTGNATGIQAAVVGPVIAQSGSTYTLTETAAGGGSLADYTSAYACRDVANGDTQVAAGTGTTFTLKFPATTALSPNIVCTFTNTPVTTSILLMKTVAEGTLVVGGTLHYSYLVTNSGNVTLAPVTINETAFTGSGPRPVPVCPAGAASLAPGAQVTCTATYTVTQADVDAGTVDNTATAQGISPSGRTILSAPSTADVPSTITGAISLVKSVSPTSFSSAATTLHYSFLVTNTGNVTLHAIHVTDTDLPGLSAVTCPSPSIGPGVAETCTATYQTTQANVDAGSVTNVATAEGTTPAPGTTVDSAPSTATVPATQRASIAVVKSATEDSFSSAGITLNYHFLVTNTGNVTLTSVQVVDTDLPGLSAISCKDDALRPGESEDCTAKYVTKQADVDAGAVTNTATAQGDPPGSTTPVISDPSTATVPSTGAGSISLLKSATPASFSTAGTTLHFSYLVTNTGDVTLAPITINEISFTGSGGTPVPDCPAGAASLAPGASVTCTVTYLTTQADVDAGSVTNTATAQGDPPGSTTPLVSQPSAVTVPSTGSAAITLLKSATPDSFSAAGQTLHYSFLVTNSGNQTLSAIGVNDSDLPGLSTISCPDATLAPGASETCTATYLTTQADVDAGQVVNTATAQGDPPGSTTPLVSDPSTATVPSTGSAAITLLKSATPDSFSAAGQTLHYSFLVTNSGNQTLSAIGVNDSDLPGLSTISCPDATLAPGASETCTATYLTTQADVDAGQVVNTATAQGDPPGSTTPLVSEPSTSTVPSTGSGSITLLKTATEASFATAGTTLHYSFLVTNTGAVTLSAIGVSDSDLPGLSAISCPDATLAPGASETCTATYVTTQADVDAGSVVNSATAQGDPPGSTTPLVSEPSTATVPATGSGAITLLKSATPGSFAAAGTTLHYSFLVTNTGTETLSAIGVSDSDLPGLSAITCPDATLAPAASETCHATYVTTQADVDAGSVVNTATAQGDPPGSTTPVVSQPSTATVPATQAPALTVQKSATPGTFDGSGQTITYHYVVTNTGNVTLTGVKVSDGLAGLSAVDCPATALDAGDAETCTATYLTTQADVNAGSVVNTATAQGDPPGSTTPVESPPSEVTVPAVQTTTLTVVKSAQPTTYDAPGTTIHYSYLVTNTGDVTLTDIRVNDGLPGLSSLSCPTPTLNGGASETCTATYVTTQADVNAGDIVNTAIVQGTPAGSTTPVFSPPSAVTVTATQSPALTLVKSALPTSFSGADTTIAYSYLVTNSGNVTMSDIRVGDVLPGLSAVDCPIGILDAGESETCTATYLTTQADVDAGKVVNSATAQGDPPGSDTPLVSPPSGVTVTAIQHPDLTLDKSASPDTFDAAGQTISYRYLVTNSGNMTLSGIAINDALPGLSAVTCPLGTLTVGDSELCTATYVTTQADLNAGKIVNTATAQGTPPGSDTPLDSMPAQATVTGIRHATIEVVKSASPAAFDAPGITIHYSYLVTNTGNVTLSGIKVDDPLTGLSPVSCPDATLDAGKSETCTATYVTTQADVDSGSVPNSATAQGNPPGSDTPKVSPPSAVTVPATQNPALTVEKSAAPGKFSGPGQTIRYSFLVTNTGNVTLTEVAVNDPLAGLSAVSCPEPTLHVGASETCTATYVTTQADVDAGAVLNSASAQGDPPGSDTPVDSPPSDNTVTGTQNPALTVVKSASPSSFSSAGQTISYRYLVTNSGNVTMSNLGISDALPGLSAISCPQLTLDTGTSETCTASYLTTQADLDQGSVFNTASAHGTPPGSDSPVSSPPSDATVTGTQAASLSLAKSALPATFSGPGQTITYSYLVTNTGNVTMSGIKINDALPGLSAISCPQPRLDAGQSETCTATYVTTQADVDAGKIVNSATAQGTPPGSGTPVDSPPSQATVDVTQAAGLTVAKSAAPDTFSGPGQTITYSFLVTNTGNVTMSGIAINDALPGLSAVTCPQSTLNVGAHETCTATYVTTQADVDAGKITNSATAQGDPPGSTTPVESPPSGNTVTGTQSADLTIVKSASPMKFTGPGQTITFSFLVSNTGNVTMSGVTVSDGLPGLSAVTCPQTTLAAGRNETCTATYLTTQADVDAGQVYNAATALGTPPGTDTPVSSPPSDVTVTATQRPALTVVKSASPSTYTAAGQTITFSFLVTNSGNVTMGNIRVDDALPGLSPVTCPQPALTVGQSETCTATYVTTQANLNAGKITNSATAQGTPPGSATPIDSPPAQYTVTAEQHSTLELVKSASPATFHAPGQTITYHFRVTNTGNVTLSNVKVSDSLSGVSPVSCPLTSLDAGESETCTATYVTRQADVDHGSVHNSATAQGTPPGSDTPKLSPPSDVTVPAERDPALKVVKTGAPATFSAPGQTITFSFLVSNTGNVTMSSISVNDALPGLSPVSCPQSVLAVGKSETCTATYVTTQADLDAGSIVNSANAQGDPPGSDTPVESPPGQTTVTADKTPALSVVKSATPATFTAAGQTIHYSFLVTNTGNQTLSSVSINDALPGLSAISCPVPTLSAGGTETCTATYVTTQADVDAGSVYNTATAQGDPPGSTTPVLSPPSDNTVAGSVTPALTLVKSARPASFTGSGQTITYSFLVTNSGNVTMSGIAVNDTMPGLSPVTCPQSNLDVGKSETCTATYVTTQADVDAGSIVNSATAQGTPPGSTTPVGSAPSSFTVTSTQTPALKVVKSASPSTFNAAGQTIIYSFLVTNTGNVSMTGIQINDTMSGLSAITCPAGTLAAGASETCTASYVTTQTDVNAGSILNSATAQGNPPGSTTPVVSPPSAITVHGAQAAAINVVKTANPTTFSKVGTTIYYSYLVTNTGNITLNAVQVDDPMQELSQILCPATTLAPGASMTCTGMYVTTQADVDAGAITDYATVQGNPTGSSVPTVSQPSRTTVSVVQGPALTVVKTASRSTFSRPGTLIQFTFKVANTGNVTLNNVQVIDTSLPGLSSINCPVTSLLVGGQETCTASYTTTKADVKSGKVTNTATAEGTPSGSSSAVGSPPSSVTVVFIAPPAPKPHLWPHRVPVTG
jgi:uncharacterized repeat protein (TIGR01451 family)